MWQSGARSGGGGGASAGADISDRLVLFLQCAVFTVLRVRGLYPADSFFRRRTPFGGQLVWWSACEAVEDYVVGVCDSLRQALARDRLRRLLLWTVDQNRGSEARYVITMPAEPQLLARWPVDRLAA
eukprot:TRINITY_DN67326_c0_g1_i1.p1 TRINITY_DN67326_c0_g1~~TRINITY_DN67326_c0_g1_i1.p1  ORF type:complete len:127 (+),score=21.90 TRINITY_DN67326_c0_g1_i1:139-519(+)